MGKFFLSGLIGIVAMLLINEGPQASLRETVNVAAAWLGAMVTR